MIYFAIWNGEPPADCDTRSVRDACNGARIIRDRGLDLDRFQDALQAVSWYYDVSTPDGYTWLREDGGEWVNVRDYAKNERKAMLDDMAAIIASGVDLSA
jgi:hypothetical protein